MSEIDPQLLDRVRRRDIDALVEYLDLLRPQLLGFIAKSLSETLKRKVEPEDILQEVAIEAINSWHSLDDEKNAGAWLVVLAKRKVARVLRDQVGVAARDPRRERAIKTDFGVADARSGPVTAADRQDRLVALEKALQTLSADHREVILLTRIEGLSAREVGERMGRTENAVNLLLGRALKRLAEELNL